MHDFYETVYHYPNLPYFQQKGKNKNPNYTNKKFYYRRYVLSEYEQTIKSNPEQAEEKKKAESLGKNMVNGSSELLL